VRAARGFTLLETLITTFVLVFGLSAIVLMFTYTARVNIETRQRTTAAFLLSDKLEEFRFASLTDDIWRPGRYVDYPVVADTSYVREWEITDTIPRNVTLTVLRLQTRKELVRGGITASR
jgi:Tfp pilus assembly protein PilV